MINLPAIFPQIEVRVYKKDKMQPGLTLCNLSNRELGVPITAVVFDAEGYVHWWFQHGQAPDIRGDIDMRELSEGVLIGGTNISHEKEGTVPPALVSWEGKVLWRGEIVNHHHIHRNPEGNFMFLVNEKRYFPHLNASLVGDVIIEYDPASSRIIWEWHLFDHVTPKVRRKDWSHCNTIEPDPRDGSLYLSARNVNSIFKIDRKSGDIIWRLGEDGDFDIPPEDMFYHQHAPEIQPNGNILLFDNGALRPEDRGGEYSRGLELAIDEDSMRAEAVWSWRNTPDLFCPIWGDADRLENGNTLLVFGNRVPMHVDTTTMSGRRIPPQSSRIIEVTPEGEKVWELEFVPAQWGVYRAERINEKDKIYALVDSRRSRDLFK